jgi:hypothetical protein
MTSVEQSSIISWRVSIYEDLQRWRASAAVVELVFEAGGVKATPMLSTLFTCPRVN